jgi:hypothetical protein
VGLGTLLSGDDTRPLGKTYSDFCQLLLTVHVMFAWISNGDFEQQWSLVILQFNGMSSLFLNLLSHISEP